MEQAAAVLPLPTKLVTDADIGTAPSEPVYSPDQIAMRRRADVRRAAAMVSDFDTILALQFRAISPASFSRLVVIGSPFLDASGQAEAGAADVRDYLWNHALEFDPSGAGRSAWIASLERHLFPPWLRWRYSARRWHDRKAVIYAQAIAQIRELVRVAFADEPPPGSDGARIRASLEAGMVDAFARMYGWDPEKTRAMPLRRLYQYLACSDRIDFDAEEAATIAEELRKANEGRMAKAN